MRGVDIGHLMKKANALSEQIEKRKEELESQTVEADAGEGRVVAVATGAGQIQSLKIRPDVVSSISTAELEDLIVAATNAALQKASRLVKDELSKLTGGIKIPGLT